MTVVLMGAGPRAAGARSLLQQLLAPAEVEEALPSPEALARHSALPPALLVLVDPLPMPPVEASPPGILNADLLRAEALRAVFALELARRAARTLVLTGDATGWPAALAATTQGATAPMLADFPPPLDSGIPQGVAPLVDTYLRPIWRSAAGGHAPSVAWPREAFLDGDAPGEALPPVIEVAGRARIVAYGPYLPVPAGAWRATAWLGFSPDIGRLPFILELDSGGAVSRAFFEAERGGIFSLDLDFRVADPLHPLELRLITQDSALEGQAALIEVRLDPA
jgi:hypothetical protein